MTALELFDRMAPLVAPMLEAEFERYDLCILATRVAIETARYFGVQAEPLSVKLIAYNQAFAAHVANGFAGVDESDPRTWKDGAWSVGIRPSEGNKEGRWNGHLIAVADGAFGDFSIQQAERLEHDIHIGPALVGPYSGEAMWKAINDAGTVVEYARRDDRYWRTAPDWKDEQRRRPIVGRLIRTLATVAII